MKQIIPLLVFIAGPLAADATVHIVTCQNGPNHFLPVTVNAIVGDTIHWTWVSGNHIVGPIAETDIPTLADSWYGVIDVNFTDFEYVVAYPGNYNYVCHPGSPHGEDGFIVVAGSTAVEEAQPTNGTSLLYPNPFSDKLTIEASGANGMTLHNVLGEQVGTFAFVGGGITLRADPGTLPKGIYFCSILRNGVVLETRRVVKQ